MSKELILEEGKYTYIQHESGGAEALRYGEHWRDLTGDKFIGAMADRIEELERDLLNLVCRIHRDGGHYIAKYGEAKAIADADTVAAQNNADLDAMQADRDEWKARAEFSYRQRDELNRLCEFNEKTMSTLQADNARLREALENCRLLAARHRKEEWAGHVLRLCESAGVAATALRSPK